MGTVPGNAEVLERHRDDAAVILDLANGDTEDFAQFDCGAVAFRSLCVGENEQAFGVSTHASSQVVYPIHHCELVSVAFFGFKRVDRFELTVEQRLVTACEVYEGVGDSILELCDLAA